MRLDNFIGWSAICGAIVLACACHRHDHLIGERCLEELNKGVSTEAEVRQVMGEPDSIWADGDGAHTLEYVSAPNGVRTWMFRIDATGTLSDYQQVLTDSNFQRVHKGMRREAVRRLLGPPRSVVPFQRQNEEVWDWKYLHAHEQRLFNVHFDMDSGLVVATSISEIAGH